MGLIATPAAVNADTVLGVYAGAQGWNMGTSGGFADQDDVVDFDFDSQTNGAFYVALEHGVPFVPNVKLNRTIMDTEGDSTLTRSFTFDGQLFIENTSVDTTIDLNTTDVIFYYELFDNDLVSIDAGLNAKVVDGDLRVVSEQTAQEGRADFSGVVPMIYSRVAVGLPFTGLGAYFEGSYLSLDDNEARDFQAAITYSFIESLALDMTLQLGYRDVRVELDDLDNTYTDLSFDGAFAGIEFHF
ncbi:TIGR04219 family outer membrane beta-barrel protein [Alteromonas sp. SM 2104]|nr:TIGR04219 family outer membrane beta-barrel protein [Alteromonas oceanisediminis]MBT0585858.1 TIGR04219 family outer membrane beta-barrel protein [Alteromonas oceanisediminis]